MTTNYETSTEIIVGKTIEKAEISRFTYKSGGYRVYGDDYDILTLTFTDGDGIKFYHDQDCCEYVAMTKYDDLEKLNGLYVKTFDKIAVTDSNEDDYKYDLKFDHGGSRTVTKLVFNDEFIIEWLGASNGYYSESVDYKYIPATIDTEEE